MIVFIGGEKMARKFYYTFDTQEGIEVEKMFKHCPKCGQYGSLCFNDGDYRGDIYCLECDFEMDFSITYKDVEK